jgi:arginyl-tRNA synthetase
LFSFSLSSFNLSEQIYKIHYNRLALCEATTRIMAACFHILGIKPVLKM